MYDNENKSKLDHDLFKAILNLTYEQYRNLSFVIEYYDNEYNLFMTKLCHRHWVDTLSQTADYFATLDDVCDIKFNLLEFLRIQAICLILCVRPDLKNLLIKIANDARADISTIELMQICKN